MKAKNEKEFMIETLKDCKELLEKIQCDYDNFENCQTYLDIDLLLSDIRLILIGK